MEYKSEAHLQSICVKWFDRAYVGQQGRLRMIYNNPPNARMGAVLKSMGLRKGTSDLVYFAPGGKIHWIEMKLRGERQSDSQKDFQLLVEEYGGSYILCYSEQDFQTFINSLNNGRQ